jgi:hypothetical protein
MTVATQAAATPTPNGWFVAERDCGSLLASTLALRESIEGTFGSERDAALAVLAALRRPCESETR